MITLQHVREHLDKYPVLTIEHIRDHPEVLVVPNPGKEGHPRLVRSYEEESDQVPFRIYQRLERDDRFYVKSGTLGSIAEHASWYPNRFCIVSQDPIQLALF